VQVDPRAPQSDAIQEAATWIRDGGVVALPTDTLYGLAVNPFDRTAVARLFAAKGRPEARALPLIAADAAQVVTWIGPLSATAGRLARRFWPGPLTLLMPAPVALAREVSAGTGRVGVRVPADHIACAVAAAVGTPITATSANVTGDAPTDDPDVVERTLGRAVDFLLDTGKTPGGAPSTIVDVTAEPPELIRAGAIPWDEVQACLRHHG
jgi:L-threonylcarbamoyladenylate synthase